MDASALTLLFRYNGMSIQRNLEGITHEESLRAPEPGGNSLNWVLGHLLLTRNTVHKLLGLPKAWEADGPLIELYKRGSQDFDPAAAVPLQDLIVSLNRSEEAVLAALGQVSPETLAKPLEGGGGGAPLGDGTVGGSLVGLGFHEAYHSGQIGILRRLAGKPGAIG